MLAPNQLTVLRMILTPFGAALLVFAAVPYGVVWSLVIFIIAMATDALDGYIARKYHLKSDLGAFLDPLSDKLLVLVYVILLQQQGVYPGWLVALTVAREMLVDAYRTYAYSAGVVLPARVAGKIKTVLQSVSIPLGILAVAMRAGQVPPFGVAPETLIFASAVILGIAFAIGLDVFRDVRRSKAAVFIG